MPTEETETDADAASQREEASEGCLGVTARQWLEIQRESGTDRRDVVPHPETSELGVAAGSCPGCGAEPFLLRASAPEIYDRSTLRGNGHAECCGDAVGFVYAVRDTLFGLEEDRAMLQWGRARVYQ